MDLWLVVDSRVVASIGLGMDIFGIGLLFRYGGIGSKWIDDPVNEVSWDSDYEGLARNERKARWGSGWGLGLAVTGFALQAVAQWL